MIPGLKEQLVGLINEPGYVPLKMEELAKIFDIHTSERPMFYNFIEELEQDGYVVRTKKNKIMSAEQAGLLLESLSHTKKDLDLLNQMKNLYRTYSFQQTM